MILSQISKIAAGHPFRGKIPESPGSGVVAVQMKDVSIGGGINWLGCVETNPLRSEVFLEDGDILVAARGNHNYAVLVEGPPQALAAPHFFVVRAIQDQVLPEFLVWLLNQTYCQRYFDQNAEGSVTKSIRKSVLESTPVTIPPLDRQLTIVRLAKVIRYEQQALDALVKNNEKLLAAIADDLFTETNRTKKKGKA